MGHRTLSRDGFPRDTWVQNVQNGALLLPPSLHWPNRLRCSRGKWIVRRHVAPQGPPKLTWLLAMGPFPPYAFLTLLPLASVLCTFKTQSASSLLGKALHLLLPTSCLAQKCSADCVTVTQHAKQSATYIPKGLMHLLLRSLGLSCVPILLHSQPCPEMVCLAILGCTLTGAQGSPENFVHLENAEGGSVGVNKAPLPCTRGYRSIRLNFFFSLWTPGVKTIV